MKALTSKLKVISTNAKEEHIKLEKQAEADKAAKLNVMHEQGYEDIAQQNSGVYSIVF